MCAKHTILTILEAIRKHTLRRIIAQKTKSTLICIYRVLALIAVFAFLDLVTIHTIFTTDNPFGIIDMFRVCCIDTEITVFYMVSMIREFSIFTVFCKKVGTRYTELERMELFEEAFAKIKINTIAIWRPIIAPPDFLIINGEWFIW